MSASLRITATGDIGLSVEARLGSNHRQWWSLEPGESVDLGVGGNQTLIIDLPQEEPAAFVTPDDEPAVQTPWIEGQDELPLGVDVLPEAGKAVFGDVNKNIEALAPASVEDGDGGTNAEATDEVDVVASVPVDPVAAVAADPDVENPLDDGKEEFVIGPDDTGDLVELGLASEEKGEGLLETGLISDLESPFDDDEKEEQA